MHPTGANLPSAVYTQTGLVGQWNLWPDIVETWTDEERWDRLGSATAEGVIIDGELQNDGATRITRGLPKDVEELLSNDSPTGEPCPSLLFWFLAAV